MATRVDLDKSMIKKALTTAIASLRRQTISAANPMIKDLLEKDLSGYRRAIETLTDIK